MGREWMDGWQKGKPDSNRVTLTISQSRRPGTSCKLSRTQIESALASTRKLSTRPDQTDRTTSTDSVILVVLDDSVCVLRNLGDAG